MGVSSCDLNLGCSSCSLLEAAWASSCHGTILPQWVSQEEESRPVSGKKRLAGASIAIYGSPFHRT